MNRTVRPVLAFTVFLTGLELLIVAHPRLGMQLQDVLVWLLSAHVLYLLFSYTCWRLVCWWRHAFAEPIAIGLLLALHLGLTYRMVVAVNFYMRDVRVWGVSILILLFSLGLGWLLAPRLPRIEKILWGFAGFLVVLLPFRALMHEDIDSRSYPDIVLISLDTTRPDVLGAYGSSNQTPNIDALAARSVRFTQAITPAPLTEPAHLSMLTGRDTLQTGVVSNGTRLGEQPAFITKTLKKAGYHTGAFVSGFPLHSRYGWAEFFDVYDDDFGDWMGLHRLHIVQAWDQIVLPAHTLRERRGDTAVARARRWLSHQPDRPHFLWLHLFDPHAPYEAPGHPFNPPTDGEQLELPAYWPPPHRAITDPAWLVEAYRAEVRYVDQLLGPLLDMLSDDTIVILTADHGESLEEHDYLFEHGDNLFEPSLLIPLLLSAPALEAQVNDCLVSSMDIPSTILSLLDLNDEMQRAGAPLQNVLNTETCPERIQLSTTVAARFVDKPPVSVAARRDGSKLIQEEETAHCYNLESDPNELSPLAPDECISMLRIAIELAQDDDVRAPELDAQTQDALEALGYIE